jgi:hypothetical protein
MRWEGARGSRVRLREGAECVLAPRRGRQNRAPHQVVNVYAMLLYSSRDFGPHFHHMF